jgi:hypothetical protein
MQFRFSQGRYPIFTEIFAEEAVFSPLYVFAVFVKTQVGLDAWIHIWIFYSVLLVFMSVFVPGPCFFVLLWYSLKLGIVISPALFFLSEVSQVYKMKSHVFLSRVKYRRNRNAGIL